LSSFECNETTGEAIESLDSNEFLTNPSCLTLRKAFSPSYNQRLAENPLFEVLSLLVPTGPLIICSIFN